MKKLLKVMLTSALLLQMAGCTSNAPEETKPEKEAEVETQETYDSYVEHGQNLFKSKKYDKALENYQKAYDMDSSKPEVYVGLFKTYTVMKNKEEAQKVEEDAKEKLSEDDFNLFLTLIGKPQNNDEPTSSLQFAKAVDIISVYVGTEVDYNDYFQGSSPKSFTIDFDDSKVDLNTPGEYPLVVTLKETKGKSLKKEAVVVVEESEYEFAPGMYRSPYRMNVRSEANTYSEVVGEFAENFEVAIDQVVKADDGSYWGVLSTGYVCLQNEAGTYFNFSRNRVPLASDFGGDNNAFLDQVCPAVNGLGGAVGPDAFVGNVNRTMSCDNIFIVY